ncbi:MAG: inositol 2-dehydrogenase [Verrucomicrobiota bacterium]
MSRTKIGIAGLGRIGQVHLQNLVTRLPLGEVVAVSDPVEAGRETAAGLGIEGVHADYEALVADESIEAVLICSPTDTHADFLLQAVARGKAVFCEKPLDLSLARAREVAAEVERTRGRVMVGFNRRFDPGFHKIRNQVQAGEIGRPTLVRITSRDPSPPPIDYVKRSGGMFMDMTIHDFDMARYLMGGQEVEEVFACGANLIDPAIGEAGDIDTASILLRFADGATATIDNSRQAVYGYDQRLEVFGPKGLKLGGNRTDDSVVTMNAGGETGPLPQAFFMERYAESYLLEIEAFLEAVRTGAPMPADCQDGVAAIVLAEAANISMAENRPVPVASV